jgi:uncharacterized OB-fold protein
MHDNKAVHAFLSSCPTVEGDLGVLERYPDARIDRDNHALYEGWLRHELRLNRCGACRAWHHPPRPVCPRCWSFEVRPTPVSGRGVVALTTLLRRGPDVPGVEYPQPVVAVELEEQEGLRFTATVVDVPRNAPVPIGTHVELTWIERGRGLIPAFRVVGDGP